MMAANDSIKRLDVVAILERPARLLAVPRCPDSVLKFDGVRLLWLAILLR